MQETQRRQEVEMAYQNPHGLDEELHELRLTAQRLRKSREEVKLYWEAKFNENVNEFKQEEAFSLHAQVISDKWFVKCEEVVKLANHLIHILHLRLRDAFE